MNIFKGLFKGMLGIVTAPIHLLRGLFSQELGKALLKGAKLIAAMIGGLLAAPHVGPVLDQLGVSVNQDQLAMGLAAMAEALRNYLKHKVKFLSWL